jgi:hypothetical protein
MKGFIIETRKGGSRVCFKAFLVLVVNQQVNHEGTIGRIILLISMIVFDFYSCM